ncbi:MAG TPA: FUSC family protein, partial [Acetobacteraceae bacterium]|nr:FUSC family protein [Acetobacteraceae bacterium]
AEAVGLIELRQRAGMFDRDLRSRAAIDTMLIETLAELLTLQRVLPADTPIEARLPFAETCEACARAFEHGDMPVPAPYRPTDTVLRGLSPETRPVIVAMAEAMTRLSGGIARRRTAPALPAVPTAKSVFVPDAFSNPGYVRFALKTTIAVMAAYITYSLLDWGSIRTSVTTCFFVALSSFGESMHKLTLRISGALIGGLIAGVCIVYVLPLMTDIGQLSLLIVGVSFVGAWVATSSDRLSYAGMQMVFAFYLGILQGYGPATDLKEMRDRFVGILLGNVLISLVFSVLWPTSALDLARSSMATALRTLGHLVTGDARSQTGPRLAVVRALAEARRLVAIAAFELRMLPAHAWPKKNKELSLCSLERLIGATFVVVDQDPGAGITDAVHQQDEAVSAWLVASADRLSTGEMTVVAPEGFSDLGPALAALSDEAPASLRAALEARMLLQSEIEDVVASRA